MFIDKLLPLVENTTDAMAFILYLI